jgi:hypothetical protein
MNGPPAQRYTIRGMSREHGRGEVPAEVEVEVAQAFQRLGSPVTASRWEGESSDNRLSKAIDPFALPSCALSTRSSDSAILSDQGKPLANL